MNDDHMATGIMTIADFLGGVSQLMTESGIQWVCAKRRLTGNEVLPQYEGETYEDENGDEQEYTALTERDLDLAEGTAYYWLSNLPVGGSTEKVSDGGWSHSEGGWTVSKANIEEWLRKYRALFDKWDEPLLTKSTIRIVNF